ncbi:hypothetical protein GCM10009087_15350 [Sphingomonas oligophenolica]|uniref:Glycosyltransferase n=1 Tax=Sphingomonas oligophenolica TaxID=301154 RepID=A0ABU9YBY6_9SPHN
MIAQVDVNTIWRRQFGLAVRRRWPDTLLVSPRKVSLRGGGAAEDGVLSVGLPPGWATRTSAVAMPILGCKLRSQAARRGGRIETIIFTSFHYLPLARALQGDTQIIYYCSDDYSGYDGWGGDAALSREGEMCRLASLSIFVSAALRDRAISSYGVDPARCIVAANASEPRFSEPTQLPAGLAALPKPIFGTVGVLGDRIDYKFLDAVARSPEVGSLALVGPVTASADTEAAITQLRHNAKVHWFGSQPHDQIHMWMAGIDVAVIPYVSSNFNHFCSPMRLWDHLAIGQPILATEACDQVSRHPGIWVVPESGEALDRQVAGAVREYATGRNPRLETWDDRVALIAAWQEEQQGRGAQ